MSGSTVRTRWPARRTLPSSTDATFKVLPMVARSTSRPLNANEEVRAITRKTEKRLPQYTADDVFVLSGAEDLVTARVERAIGVVRELGR